MVHGKDAVNVHALIEAMDGKCQVKLVGYASSHSGVVRDRLVESFDFTTDYNQVLCYDREDERNKLFKMMRIGRVEVLKEGWMAEEKHEKGFVDVFRFSGPERYRVKMDDRDDIAQLVHFTDEEAYVVNRLIDALDNGSVLK